MEQLLNLINYYIDLIAQVQSDKEQNYQQRIDELQNLVKTLTIMLIAHEHEY
jgi:hypothetical protein